MLMKAFPSGVAPRLRRIVAVVAGPLVVLVAVVIALDDVALDGLVSGQNRDVYSFWLPTHCHLGRSIADGQIPGWNPFILGGTPLAGEPQSGWMYLPAMVLYSVLSCETALRVFILLQPALGGLGAYSFLRTEKVSRSAATIAGLTAALGMAQPKLAYTLPFAGSVAWTALVLAAAARLVAARTWSRRFIWAGMTALAWGQLAAAHLSHGLVAGTALLAFYFLAKIFTEWRRRGLLRDLVLSLVVFAVACIALNLAYFLPRLDFVPRTSLGITYQGSRRLLERVAGIPFVPSGDGVGPTAEIPGYLAFGTRMGQFLLSVVYVFSFAGLWLVRKRAVVVAVMAFAAMLMLLTSDGVAGFLKPLLSDISITDFYFHNPRRFLHPFVLAAGLLVGFGIHVWLSASWRVRIIALLPGLTIWIVLPHVLDLVVPGPLSNSVPPLTTFAATSSSLMLWELALVVLVLAAAKLKEFLVPAAVACVAAILIANSLIPEGRSVTWQRGEIDRTLRGAAYVHDYMSISALERAASDEIQDGRYLGLDLPPGAKKGAAKTSLLRLQANRRGMLFGIEEPQGFNSVQLQRYWLFVQALNQVRYNSSIFLKPYPVVLDLLAVSHVSWGGPPKALPPADPVFRSDERILYELRRPTARATLHADWTVVGGRRDAIATILESGFDSTRELVLEGAPPMETGEGPASGTADFSWIDTQTARVEVETDRDAMLLVRNVYDPGWQATVDGKPVEVMPADLFLQAVPVAAGRHQVILRYVHGGVMAGIWGSAISVAVLILAAVLALPSVRRRVPRLRRNRAVPAEPEGPAVEDQRSV
jgi:hypothetical protein